MTTPMKDKITLMAIRVSGVLGDQAEKKGYFGASEGTGRQGQRVDPNGQAPVWLYLPIGWNEQR